MEGLVKMTENVRNMNSHNSDIDKLNGMARSLERSEMRSVGTNLLQARKSIARRLGIAAATIDNFRSLRNKIVPHWLMQKVRAELIAALQSEVQNLEHEIKLHHQIGAHPPDDALASAEAQLAAARKVLGGSG